MSKSSSDKNTKEQDGEKQANSLGDQLAHSLNIRDGSGIVSFEGIAQYLVSDNCKNVITMAGAGISTSAGIPDFRSPGTGLYENLAAYDLPHPQAIFDISFFHKNPKPFFVLAKELYPGSFKPTPCHYFIKLLNDKGKLLRHYTQNIDTLERVAGLDPDKLVEAHGTFYTSHCLECNKEYKLDWMKDEIFADRVPKCTEAKCEGVVKPDIVFFGESLPPRFGQLIQSDFKKCDLLIVMGTSLTVQPFASLVHRVPDQTPRLYINLENGMSSSDPIAVLLFGGGFNFDGEDNYRDVFKKATCDEGCQELADLLGWGEELKLLVKTEHEKIELQEASGSKPSNDKTKKDNEVEKKGKKGKM
ncbi:NAD-dependent protein deacetylase sirtuin-2-like [Physella acuta]|uniref:NAD-dependent protein deacetylase sirtuin-2-like n=1 Tax=Physella acuta TaxID=109671 RepID=UPI0027DDD426|nr:NAD-dependent protein deacetylase sirtuin-2-like [Physella acuta]